MSTHPRTTDRIEQAIKLAKTKLVSNPLIKRNTYLSQIDGMTFGDGPTQGIRNGRIFTHPKFGIQFEVPPGFVLFNSPSKVVAIGPNKTRIKFDLAPPKFIRQSGSLSKYLQAYWGRNLNLKSIEPININGMVAATGVGRLKASIGHLDVRLLAIRGKDGNVFRLTFTTPPEETQKLSEKLRRTTYSFRRLTRAEANDVQPLQISIIKVRTGDTIVSLAQNMPFEKFKLEWFQVLNGINTNILLEVGQKVKIVSK